MSPEVLDADWRMLVSMLPSDLEQCARETGAVRRRREVRGGEQLLRLAFAYGLCHLSLRSTALWATERDLADLSDVALLNRLRGATGFLAQLLTDKLAQRTQWPSLGGEAGTPNQRPRRVRLVDATCVCRPGASGTDWRIHLGFDLLALRIDHAELTDASGGETLARLRVEGGDLIVADRGYSHRRGIAAVAKAGGQLIVRMTWHNVPLQDQQGKSFSILSALGTLAPGELGEFGVQTAADPKEGLPAVRGRLLALAKSPGQAEAARRELRKQAKKKGKTPSQETLEAAGYVFVFTTVAAEELDAWEVLELYRFRWQIELAFKRMKGLLALDELAAKDEQLCRSVLLTKLLGALLVEELSGEATAAVALSPWGYGTPRPPGLPLEGLPGRRQYRASGRWRRLDPGAVAARRLPLGRRHARTATPTTQPSPPSLASRRVFSLPPHTKLAPMPPTSGIASPT